MPVIAPDESGTAAPGPAASPAVPGTQASWRSCPEVPQQIVGRGASGMRYECASVAVPRDWATPKSGETYDVQMIRIRSTNQENRIGSLVLNPGGPGASGIEIAVGLSYGQKLGGLPTEITDRFDIVGFDPRGVDRSSPIRCISRTDQDALFAADPDPVSQADFDEVAALNKKIVEGCGDKYGAQLPLFSTEQAARDMDAVRSAVGDQKLTYLGYSYGTLLGATYAQLFPKNIRALVLDGAVDPTEPYIARNEAQAKGFERAFTNFSQWCARTPAQCPIQPDARGAVTDALAKSRVDPVAGPDGRDAEPGWIFTGVAQALYSQTQWPSLAKSIDSLRRGDAKGIFELADAYARREPGGRYTNLFDANMVVNCADADETPTVQQIRTLQSQWRAKYPLFGSSLAMGMLPCALWPGKHDPYPTGAATGAPPIVVVGTTGDPATPYENTADLAGMLGTGQVLTWEGEGHTAYPSTPCIVRAVDGYLIDLTVPTVGLRCPAR
ncbi:alpha/beta hydrolase [Actinoplanes sp. NPDC051633]|uniref:alpha/beta hydrolase n=1 Tax=Actinoplanes sp. NPDC051633 TaxID=3155670 RepID=UPI0034238058